MGAAGARSRGETGPNRGFHARGVGFISGMIVGVAVTLGAGVIMPEWVGRAGAPGVPGRAARLSVEAATRVGQVFFGPKVSEIVMLDEVREAYGGKSADEGEIYIASLAVALLEAPLPVSGRPERWAHLDSSTVNIAAEKLDKFGVTVVRSVAPRGLCSSAAADVHKRVTFPEVNFGNIKEPFFRKDCPLMVKRNGSPGRVFQGAVSALRPVLESALGRDPVLVEYSAMVTYPGATRQERHHDSAMESIDSAKSTAKVVSVFVYLADVHADGGALDVWPGTHTHYHFLEDEERDLMMSAPAIRIEVPAGSVVIYDSRLLHRGAENTSPCPRPSLYFSFMSRSGAPPKGPTYSLHPQYTRRAGGREISLADVVDGALTGIDEPKPPPQLDICAREVLAMCPGDPNPSSERCWECARRILAERSDFLENVHEDSFDQSPEGCLVSQFEKLCKVSFFATQWARPDVDVVCANRRERKEPYWE